MRSRQAEGGQLCAVGGGRTRRGKGGRVSGVIKHSNTFSARSSTTRPRRRRQRRSTRSAGATTRRPRRPRIAECSSSIEGHGWDVLSTSLCSQWECELSELSWPGQQLHSKVLPQACQSLARRRLPSFAILSPFPLWLSSLPPSPSPLCGRRSRPSHFGVPGQEFIPAD